MTRQTGIPIRETADGERDPLAAEKDLAEAEWEAALILFFQEQSARIRAKLEPGIPKSRKALEDLGDRLTDGFWENEDRELLAVMAPRLTAGALTGVTGAAAIVDGLGLGVDWTLANTEAAKWAREYAGQLIGVNTGGINATTRARVGERVAEFIETPGMTMDDLFDRLNTSDFSFGPVRSRMIAVTEVTRSYWEGNKAGSRWAEDEGYFKWRKQWQTLRDELVCVLCGPLHGVTVDGIDALFPDGAEDGPPRHPNCRCFLTQSPIVEEVAEEGEAELTIPEGLPQGTPVSQGLKAPKSGKYAKKYQHTLDAIDSVHGDGDLPEIPVRTTSSHKNWGQYRYGSSSERPLEIRVSGRQPASQPVWSLVNT